MDLLENCFALEKTPLSSLNQLYKELFFGGKGIRAHLVKDVSQALHLHSSEITLLCGVAESIHHSSILHDDVIDSSKKRRNRSSIWMKFSKNKAILAGDYLLAHVSLKLSEYGNADLLKLTSQTIKKMVEGEWLQSEVLGHETLNNINKIHLLKTAVLFEWCLKAPFLCRKYTNSQNLLGEIGQIFGQLFQRADDALDFGVRNKENKNEFKDLSEGYLNFFGVFLQEKAQLKNLRSCRSRLELKKMIKEEEFLSLIQSFDDMNKKLIHSCYNKLKQLSSLLNPEQRKLILTLNSWTKKLYFR